MLLLGGAVVFAIGGVVQHGSKSQGSVHGLVTCLAFLALLQFGYVRRTQLWLDADQVWLRQAFTTRSAVWADVASVRTTSMLAVTHRGGAASGVHLGLRSGGTFFIPDLFSIRRRELARRIAAAAGVGVSPWSF